MTLQIRRILFGAVLTASLAMPVIAEPQTPERLTRPLASHMSAEGKLVTSPDATFGNLAVDQYIKIGASLADAGEHRDMMVRAYKPTMCSPGGVGAMVGHSAEGALKAMSKEERAGLKARDPARLEALSIAVLADLDNVGADAIRADEAIGPGVYRNGIDALNIAWTACGFFGLERRL